MKNLKPINSKDDLIKAYPDRFDLKYLPHISQGGCHTCCAHTLKMPNSHTTLGRQEAGQTLGARSRCASYRTNRLGIIISLLMESRR